MKLLSIIVNRLFRTITTILLLMSPGFADQFVLHDNVCVFPVEVDGPYYHAAGAAFYKWRPSHTPGVILNWEEPVNYREGKAYCRYEIQKKKESGVWETGISMWNRDKFFRAHWQFPKTSFTEEGVVFNGSSDITRLGWDPGGTSHQPSVWDWTDVCDEGYIFCGAPGNPLRYRHWWDENADKSVPLYIEMDTIIIHNTVIIVSKGASFEKPDGWDEYGAMDPGFKITNAHSINDNSQSYRQTAPFRRNNSIRFPTAEKYHVELYDLAGRLIAVRSAVGVIDLSSIAPAGGLYQIRIAGDLTTHLCGY